MTGGRGGDDPPSHPLSSVPTDRSGILLRLVQNRPHTPSTDSLSSLPVQQRIHSVSRDPAVSPSIPVPMNNTQDRPSLSPHHPCPPTTSHPSSSSFSPCPHNLFRRDFPHNPPRPHHQSSPPLPSDFYLPHQQINANQQQQHHPQERSKFKYGNSPIQIPNERDNSASRTDFLRERESGLVSLNRAANGYDRNWSIDSSMHSGRQIHSGNGVYGSPEMQKSGPSPGFSGAPMNRRRSVEHNVATQMIGSSSELNHRGFKGDRRISSEIGSFNGCRRIDRSGQLERPGLTAGSSLHSASDSDIDDSILNWQADMVGSGEGEGHWKMNKTHNFSNEHEVYHDECDDLGEQLADSLIIEDGSADKKDKKKHYRRDKDFRSDARGQRISTQKMRTSKRFIKCRSDIDMLTAPFLEIYYSLIPAAEEKAKQKQLLTLLENLVRKEWPNARLYLYGSCANSFGVSKSDIDVCVTIDDKDINKSEVLLRLAEILQSDNLQGVEALTHARVPIVKLKDPVTRISCDICINNVLAVVNTKLLRDYAEIDARLRQLAYIVKHWAKSRGVNETYQGTLSSYAYVLMCIHFLQQRRPAILPCLQEMEATYVVTVDDIKCAYFDQVEKVRRFGARNRENIAQLLWAFFNYWAYCHDYANSVISVRTGSILSKREKDWTRRIGNDRHLICIEDPFETSHDLGRVVDKRSIRVLREEFERAADIMQHDPNPCVALFEPYVPR